MRRVSSCGCWRRSRRCCIATAGRARSASACPAPTASAWRPRGWLASSSTPWSCAARPGAPAVRRVARRGSRGDPRRPGQPGPAVRPGARGLRPGRPVVPGAVQPPAARPVGVAPAAPARRRAALAQPRSQVRPATAERGGRSRSPDPEFRLRRGPLRRGQYPAFRRAIPGVAAPGRGRPAALRRYRPGRRRAGGAPRRMGQRALRAARAPGCRSCWSGNWRSPPNASPWSGTAAASATPNCTPGQPPGPLPARQGRRPGRAGSDLRRAFAATAGRSAGDRQGGGAYVPLDPDYPANAWPACSPTAASSCYRPRPICSSACLARRASRRSAWTASSSTTGRARHRACTCTATISPTSSTPPVPPASRRAWAIPTRLAERLQWMQATYALDGDDVLMQKAPVSFDVSVWECFWPLVTGCRLVLAAPASTAIRRAWWNWCGSSGVTTLHFVPPLLQLFIDEPGVAPAAACAACSPAARRFRRSCATACCNACRRWPCITATDRPRPPSTSPTGNAARKTASVRRSADRWATWSAAYWTPSSTCCRPASPASCASAAWAWPGH